MSNPYIPREIGQTILDASKYSPVVTLTGPLQSGKSTLLRHLFNDVPYYSMEDLDIRQIAKSDPRGFLSQFLNGVIIDEVQNVPELLSYIQGIVDIHTDRKFYLTGSTQFALLQTVTQSLAGRTAVFELLPLSLEETSVVGRDMSMDEIMYKGFYPAVWSNKNTPKHLYSNYVKTYIERDVRNLLAVKILNRDKMRGHLFENMVIMDFLKDMYNSGKNGNLYFTEIQMATRSIY